MSQEFTRLAEYIKRLKSRYYEALCAFYAFESLREHRAPNIVGEDEAELNTEAINTCKNFFVPAERALHYMTLMYIAKFYDDADRSLHIDKLISYVEGNRGRLTADAFHESNLERELIDEIVESYETVSMDDLTELRDGIAQNQGIINEVIKYRNKVLAHEDIVIPDINLTFEDLIKLIELIETVLNTLSNLVLRSQTMYSHVKEEALADTKYIIDCIKAEL